jgi:hypothetical protein
MIKKITLTFIICCILVSCGKKGDPVYKESIKDTRIKKIY